MLHQFRILPAIDQHHLLRTYVLLTEKGADDDTITAGLIHDVGKACAKCRITILDRGLHVILNRIAPWPYRHFASIEAAPARARGLHRLANHAERGALAASKAGYNSRVIELVRHHEIGSKRNDEELRLLRAADHEAGRE
jgi:predicted HD phosphohydrolase